MRGGRKRRHADELHEPEILPMMNVLFMLVMVLIGMSAFLPLGVISTQASKLGGAGGGAAAVKDDLKLTVMLMKNGINLSVGGAMLRGENGPYLPKIQKGEQVAYNFDALQAKLAEIKATHQNETRISVMADPDVIYDDVIHVMDAARESKDHKLMFPEVAFVPGVIN
jgi:biopolymer transport protein ExbD